MLAPWPADRQSQTASWLPAKRTPTESYRARRENRLGHAVNDLFGRRTNRCQHAAQVRAGAFRLATDKVVRTQAHASFQRHNFIALEIEPLGVDQPGLVITLQDIGR